MLQKRIKNVCRRMSEKTWLPDHQTSTLKEKPGGGIGMICHKEEDENVLILHEELNAA